MLAYKEISYGSLTVYVFLLSLFIEVFGESVLNDGVCIVLFDAFTHMVRVGGHESDGSIVMELLGEFMLKFIGSYLLGLASGMLSAFILKTNDLRKHRMLELSFYLLVMYWPFFVAEAIGLNAIVTILFTGMSARHYASKNLSVESGESSKLLFRVVSHVCEAVIFLQIGLSLFGLQILQRRAFPWRFTAWTFLACLIGRGCSIFPVTFLINLRLKIREKFDCRRLSSCFDLSNCQDADGVESYYAAMSDIVSKCVDQWVGWKTAAMLWWSGLRGAVAYACATTFPDTNANREEFAEVSFSNVYIICTYDLHTYHLRRLENLHALVSHRFDTILSSLLPLGDHGHSTDNCICLRVFFRLGPFLPWYRDWG